MTVRANSLKVKPASLTCTSTVLGTVVTWKAALKVRLDSSVDEVKVWLATAPVTGAPFRYRRAVIDEGIVVPALTETVLWKVA